MARQIIYGLHLIVGLKGLGSLISSSHASTWDRKVTRLSDEMVEENDSNCLACSIAMGAAVTSFFHRDAPSDHQNMNVEYKKWTYLAP
jgi:hypothetical protein